uniref:Plastid light harvesting protein n=1 Tax=Craspedostauros australis TaxID=1486917 RepID=A0A7R9WPE2_9STRA|mmetsp:Transcript_14709/g.40670  ORF Transcript_14709/g.40670 Transcript_14709/m.40670 type:complete len:207 (+) Transcript_14709:137-757(+)
MVKTLMIAAALAGTASAFAPSQSAPKAVTSLNEFANGLVGGEGPEPIPFSSQGSSVNWDPCGFTERAPEWVPWFREAELKHGRAAMLATVGIVVPEFVRIPGEQFSFESIPNIIDAHDALPDSMIQIFAWISFIEACTFPALANMNNYDRQPGDYSFDPLGFFPEDEAAQERIKLVELKNGRLAMIAIGGMVTQATMTGHGFPYLP